MRIGRSGRNQKEQLKKGKRYSRLGGKTERGENVLRAEGSGASSLCLAAAETEETWRWLKAGLKALPSLQRDREL